MCETLGKRHIDFHKHVNAKGVVDWQQAASSSSHGPPQRARAPPTSRASSTSLDRRCWQQA
eukprot:10758806-Heterocapsa_arctica.AAC.1